MADHKRYSINEASKEDLTQIPGIDDRRAEAIIEFRDRRGWINNLEELTEAGPVEPREMHQLREWLTVASERTGSLDYEGPDEEPDAL